MNIKQTKEPLIHSEDPLINWLLLVKEYGRKNINLIIGAVVGVVVIAGGVLTFQQIQKSSVIKAADVFGKAMISYNAKDMDKAIEQLRTVADNHGSTPQGYQSAYMLGNILYGKEKYDEAITWYTEASKGGEVADFIAGQALEGIALCYEAKGDAKNAISFLEKALNDSKIKFRHNAIKWKIALLTKGSDASRARTICNELVSDTLATEFREKAENLLAAIEFGSAS